jgi:hypothetical protein
MLIWPCDAQHNDIQLKTVSTKGLFSTLSMKDTQHNNTLPLGSVPHFSYCYPECYRLSVVELNVFMMSIYMSNVVMLIVVVLIVVTLSVLRLLTYLTVQSHLRKERMRERERER